MPYNQDDIQWSPDGQSGIQENFNICSKEMRWWIRLSNGQANHVATVKITVNPFPMKGSPYLAGVEFDYATPDNLRDYSEMRRFSAALFAAGEFCGEQKERASQICPR